MSRKPSRVCFVGCLGTKTTEEDLYEFFRSKIGGVEAINLKRDGSGNSRRFALVTFETPELAHRAIDELDDTRFNNTIINVEEYKTKRQQNIEREEDNRDETPRSEKSRFIKRERKEENAEEEDNHEDEESDYSSSSSSSSSSSPKRRKHHHHRHHHSSSETKSKKSKSDHKKHRHRHHHHRYHH